jgi:hypothetical protein
MTGRTTRADRLAHPTTRDAIRAVAENHGACLHPIQLRRINTGTGQTDQILIPCGATFRQQMPALRRTRQAAPRRPVRRRLALGHRTDRRPTATR